MFFCVIMWCNRVHVDVIDDDRWYSAAPLTIQCVNSVGENDGALEFYVRNSNSWTKAEWRRPLFYDMILKTFCLCYPSFSSLFRETIGSAGTLAKGREYCSLTSCWPSSKQQYLKGTNRNWRMGCLAMFWEPHRWPFLLLLLFFLKRFL